MRQTIDENICNEFAIESLPSNVMYPIVTDQIESRTVEHAVDCSAHRHTVLFNSALGGIWYTSFISSWFHKYVSVWKIRIRKRGKAAVLVWDSDGSNDSSWRIDGTPSRHRHRHRTKELFNESWTLRSEFVPYRSRLDREISTFDLYFRSVSPN